MIEILITAPMKVIAKKEAKIMENSAYDVKNYHGLDEDNRFYNGLLGELAFRRLLDDRGIKYQYHAEHDEYADKGDFVLYTRKGKFKVDVKTCSKPSYVNMLIPKTQQTKYLIYVGVRLNGNTAQIMGYAKQDQLYEITKPKPKIPSVGMRLDELTDVEKMFGYLEKSALQ